MEIKMLRTEWYEKADAIYSNRVRDCRDAMYDMDEELKRVEECCQKANLGSIGYVEKSGLIEEWNTILERLKESVYGIGGYLANHLDGAFHQQISDIYDRAVLHDLGDYKTRKTIPGSDRIGEKLVCEVVTNIVIEELTGVTGALGVSTETYITNMTEIYQEKYRNYKKANKGVSFQEYIAYNVNGKAEFDLEWNTKKFFEGMGAWIREIPDTIVSLGELLYAASGVKSKLEGAEFLVDLVTSEHKEEDINKFLYEKLEEKQQTCDIVTNLLQMPKMMMDQYTTMNQEQGTAYMLGYSAVDIATTLIDAYGAVKGIKAVAVTEHALDAATITDHTADVLRVGDHLEDLEDVAGTSQFLGKEADEIVEAIEGGVKIDIDVKPTVTNEKLKNIVNDLYKGQGGANTIGNGTTMDAVRNEIVTGQATNGKFHTSKLNDYVNALEKRLRAGDLNPNDEAVVKALLEDAKNALTGK